MITQQPRLDDLPAAARDNVIFPFLSIKGLNALLRTCKHFRDHFYSKHADNFEPIYSLKKPVEPYKNYGQLVAIKSPDAQMYFAVSIFQGGMRDLAVTVAKKQLSLMKSGSDEELNTVLCMGGHGFWDIDVTQLSNPELFNELGSMCLTILEKIDTSTLDLSETSRKIRYNLLMIWSQKFREKYKWGWDYTPKEIPKSEGWIRT